MGRKKRIPKALPTIWHVSDELWELIQPILKELDPLAKTGRKRIAPRAALDGIIYQMRSGCQWNVLPGEFGDDSSVHRTFQRWIALGPFDRVWALLIQQCEELGGVDCQWQAADAVRAPDPTFAREGCIYVQLVAKGNVIGELTAPLRVAR